jgi:hypothetical protein
VRASAWGIVVGVGGGVGLERMQLLTQPEMLIELLLRRMM